MGRGNIMVVAGGVIPAQDYEYPKANGASAIFGPGTVIPVAAQKVIRSWRLFNYCGFVPLRASLHF